MDSLKDHWEEVYRKTPTEQLGWFEESPQPTIELIQACSLPRSARILSVGAGTSSFIDYLLEEGFQQILATDISSTAIEQLKERLGEKRSNVEWIVDDLTQSTILHNIKPIDLWYDRAVLHFFTQANDQQSYFNLLRKLVKPGGFVIIAAFSLTGAKKCSGLPVKNYSTEMLREQLGSEFQLLRDFDFIYTTPGGNPRDYVYTLFQRLL
ncbi:class I SAM-dependent methyltransferase [Sunxiuqinia sp. A32]|uniref:class I SAM-dependent methyltransferase n=1 Tax=Sunxiuqinia sp. A32 TaxID=3461496 RepID=UPI0040466B6D